MDCAFTFQALVPSCLHGGYLHGLSESALLYFTAGYKCLAAICCKAAFRRKPVCMLQRWENTARPCSRRPWAGVTLWTGPPASSTTSPPSRCCPGLARVSTNHQIPAKSRVLYDIVDRAASFLNSQSAFEMLSRSGTRTDNSQQPLESRVVTVFDMPKACESRLHLA